MIWQLIKLGPWTRIRVLHFIYLIYYWSFFFCFASIILCLQIVFCTMAANNNTKIVVPLTASLDQTLRDLAVPHMVQQSLCIQYQPLGAPFELKFGLIQLFPNFMVWRMRIRINILRSFIFFAPVLFHRAFQKNRSNWEHFLSH